MRRSNAPFCSWIRNLRRERLRGPACDVFRTTASSTRLAAVAFATEEPMIGVVDLDHMNLRNRAHLLSLAARFDASRSWWTPPGDRERSNAAPTSNIRLSAESIPTETPGVDGLALDGALGELKFLELRLSRLVELKFFGGLTFARPRRLAAYRRRPSNGTGQLPQRGSLSDCRWSEPGTAGRGDRLRDRAH
jgi:hypothetical protein